MSFNLTAWKEQATTGLRKVGVNIKPFLTKKAPYIVYATLLAVAVAPLVLAAGSGYIAVVTALGALAGGAGGDMIAEQLQRWIDDAGKDPDDEALQAKIAEWISLQIAKNKDFIIDGDAILKAEQLSRNVTQDRDEQDTERQGHRGIDGELEGEAVNRCHKPCVDRKQHKGEQAKYHRHQHDEGGHHRHPIHEWHSKARHVA